MGAFASDKPKTPFADAVADIVAIHGTHISRKNLHAYCIQHNVLIPAVMYSQHRLAGVRGWFDLSTFVSKAQGTNAQFSPTPAAPPPPEMTDEEIEEDINSRFASLDLMTYGVIDQSFRSLIVSGNPGTGKTFTLETILDEAANSSKILYQPVRGYVRATGLYRLMWEHRHKECVIMMDDADSIFQDEISLNLLKGGLDTTKRRRISWRSEKVFESEDGEDIPKEFDFHGAIIFVSNINFQRTIAQGNKMAVHLEALMSRSYYLDLNLNSVREQLIRIKSVAKHSNILDSVGVKKADHDKVIQFIEDNQDRMRELSLRSLIKLGNVWMASKGDAKKFKRMASATLLTRSK